MALARGSGASAISRRAAHRRARQRRATHPRRRLVLWVEYGDHYVTVEPRFVDGRWQARIAPRPKTDEDARLERPFLGCLFGAAALVLLVAHGIVSPVLALVVAFLGGIVAAALAAPTLGRQLAYSIPFIVLTLGELFAVDWYMANTPIWHWGALVLAAGVGALPGIALYALVRWLFGKLAPL